MFFLEWFLKNLVLCVSKDVATSRVFFEEEAIMRDQHMEFIYSQSGMLYEILPNAPLSKFDLTKPNSRPHVNGVVGLAQNNPIHQLSNQMKQFSLQHTVANQNSSMDAHSTLMSEVHAMQKTNLKDIQ
jgi:hypothetical protein